MANALRALAQLLRPTFDPNPLSVNLKVIVAIFTYATLGCGSAATEAQNVQSAATEVVYNDSSPVVGADQWEAVLQAIDGRRVGAVVNHTSMSGGQHLVDRLLASEVDVVTVFAPEHGFRGTASDGEHVADQRDSRTGVPIVSLYGKSKRPTQQMLQGVDVLLFDIQDVGTRFYTYISTMHYVMDAAAEYGKQVVVLDRPNPNGHFVDGPVLDTIKFRSFIGMHPIPSVHGLTVAELARMINGEGWLAAGRRADLVTIPVGNYRVGEAYDVPIAPSPNLPNALSIALYPTLCHFEGTVASVGRGTDLPFQMVGHPNLTGAVDTIVTPAAKPGAKYAKLKGEPCQAITPRSIPIDRLRTSIDYAFIEAVANRVDTPQFIDRPKHFDLVCGTNAVRLALEAGVSLASVNASFAERRKAYMRDSCPYLLYERVGLDWGIGSEFCR